MSPEAVLAVELDADFVAVSRARCPTALVVEGDASLLASRFYNRLFREVRFDSAPWDMPPEGPCHCRGVRSLVRPVESWR